MAKTILKTDYSAKKCKEMEGHDGYVIRFDLCYKGKKVAEVYAFLASDAAEYVRGTIITR